MKYHNPEKELTVGSYYPSSNIGKFTHFAVMEENGPNEPQGGLVATVGYFQSIPTPSKWFAEDYLHAAECIEQGQLYANAHKLLAFIQELVASRKLSKEHMDIASNLISSIENIDEPLKRLLGPEAPNILGEIEKHLKE